MESDSRNITIPKRLLQFSPELASRVSPPLSWDNPLDLPILEWKRDMLGEEYADLATLPPEQFLRELSILIVPEQESLEGRMDDLDLQHLVAGSSHE